MLAPVLADDFVDEKIHVLLLCYQLLSDLGLVGRDMFADLAVKAAELARPDEDALARVDQPAPENEFHDDIPNALQRETKRKQAENAANEAGQQAQGERRVISRTDAISFC